MTKTSEFVILIAIELVFLAGDVGLGILLAAACAWICGAIVALAVLGILNLLCWGKATAEGVTSADMQTLQREMLSAIYWKDPRAVDKLHPWMRLWGGRAKVRRQAWPEREPDPPQRTPPTSNVVDFAKWRARFKVEPFDDDEALEAVE